MAVPILLLCQANQRIQLACARSGWWSKRNRRIGTSVLWTATWRSGRFLPTGTRLALGRLSGVAWRYLAAMVLRLTRASWCVRRSRLKARCLHHDIAQHVRGRDAKWRQDACARNGGERHFDIPAVGEKGQERT